VSPAPLIEARGLAKHFPIRRGLLGRTVGQVRAVEAVDLTVAPGEVVGLVGESGSGKSTIGRLLLRLLDPSAGEIRFAGADITRLPRGALRPVRRRMQMIFQDPFGSLNPRMTVGAALDEAMRVHGIGTRSGRRERAADLLGRVGLPAAALRRYPRSFSGGQRQRIAIARALAVEPAFIVADEPVSALDVSIQAEVVNLLRELQRDLGLALLFISHDLAVVEVIADRVVVLYLGRVMEVAPTEALFTRPRHPYTRALLSASPGRPGRARRERMVLSGEIPSPASPPSGCVFRTRCPFALPECAQAVPALREVAPGHHKACLRDDLDSR
jgi:oligopeptide transport system ATP-binding protein